MQKEPALEEQSQHALQQQQQQQQGFMSEHN
jgi:hypothetical protein